MSFHSRLKMHPLFSYCLPPEALIPSHPAFSLFCGMQNIQAIIFDLGGVILNIDYRRTEKALRHLGLSHFQGLFYQQEAGQLLCDLETGKITGLDFVKALQKESVKSLRISEIMDAWNAMLLDFPPERIELLRKLIKKYPVYLLSNTNPIHVEAFNNILKDQHGIDSLEPLFTKAYFSHDIRARKPDEEAFLQVIRENNLDPATTLFIDDTEANTEAARKAGLQAILLTPPTTIIDLKELQD